MQKIREALKGIEKLCDSENPSFEDIWRIADFALKEYEKKLKDGSKTTSKEIVKGIIEDFKNSYDNPNKIVAYWENKINEYINSKFSKIVREIKSMKRKNPPTVELEVWNVALNEVIEIIENELEKENNI